MNQNGYGCQRLTPIPDAFPRRRKNRAVIFAFLEIALRLWSWGPRNANHMTTVVNTPTDQGTTRVALALTPTKPRAGPRLPRTPPPPGTRMESSSLPSSYPREPARTQTGHPWSGTKNGGCGRDGLIIAIPQVEPRGYSTANDHTFQHAPLEGPPWSRHSPCYWPNRLRRPTLRTHLRGRDEPGAHQNLFRRAARRSIRPTHLFNPGPPQKSKTEKSPLLQVGSRAGRLAAGRLAAACSLANFPQRRALLSTQSERGSFRTADLLQGGAFAAQARTGL